jgi:hypothetical protein
LGPAGDLAGSAVAFAGGEVLAVGRPRSPTCRCSACRGGLRDGTEAVQQQALAQAPGPGEQVSGELAALAAAERGQLAAIRHQRDQAGRQVADAAQAQQPAADPPTRRPVGSPAARRSAASPRKERWVSRGAM